MRVGIVGDVHLTETVPKARTDSDYLETLLGKLEFIYKQCDVVVFLGDLFDKPIMSFQGFHRVLLFFLRMLREGKRSWIVMGNHDIPYLNPDSLMKSTLGALSLLRMVNVTSIPVCIESLVISTIPTASKVVCPDTPKDFPGVQMLIGHAFFENSLDPDYSVTSEMLVNSGYRYVFLGHDHEPHETVTIGNTEVYRIGSLCRNTSHEYQIKRIPQFFLFEIDSSNRVIPIGIQKVPARPGRDAFRDEAIKTPEVNEFAFLLSADTLMKRFTQFKDGEESATVLSVLKEIDAPPEVVVYIRRIYEGLGMVLR